MSGELIEVLDASTLPENASQKQLQKIAKEKANFICKQIKGLTENLKKAERLSIDAYFAKDDGFFSRTFGSGKTATDKRGKLNTRAISLQNEAIAELANLVQASISFAASSALLNQAMIQEFARVTEKGFINVYGELEQIQDDEQKEYLAQIEDGLKKNQQIHQQNKAVSRNAEAISQNTEAISQLASGSKSAMVVACLALLLSIISLAVSLTDKF